MSYVFTRPERDLVFAHLATHFANSFLRCDCGCDLSYPYRQGMQFRLTEPMGLCHHEPGQRNHEVDEVMPSGIYTIGYTSAGPSSVTMWVNNEAGEEFTIHMWGDSAQPDWRKIMPV